MFRDFFCSSVSEESIAGVAAFIGNHARELRDLKEGQERVLEGYAIAVDSFSLVRIDYRIWAQKCDARYISAAAGIRGVLDVKRTRWNDFLSAYMEIFEFGISGGYFTGRKTGANYKMRGKATYVI